MPSMHDNGRRVKEQLGHATNEPDHDAILASLQDEIDKHNSVKDDLRDTMRRNSGSRERTSDSANPSMRFRFKEGVSDPASSKKRRHRSHRGGEPRKSRRHHRSGENSKQTSPEPAHPLPRQSNPSQPPHDNPTHAFRESLFDALADDEGAQYWETVYSQPIHIYPRPTVKTPAGELEEMNDEEYATYVQTKMWEKSHPHVVLERERKERRKKEEEERRAREKEEFVRRRRQREWEKAQRWDEAEEEKTFTGEANFRADEPRVGSEQFVQAWKRYLQAWEALKLELLAAGREDDPSTNDPSASPAQRIPWPVLGSRPLTRPHIEEFMRSCAGDGQRSRLQVLKAERVRWHPDKVQQRFGSAVDEGTMKLVTGVFQIVDQVFEEERKRTGG